MKKIRGFLKDNGGRIAAIILAIFGLYVLVVHEWQGTPALLKCDFGQNVWNILVAISPELIGIAIGVFAIDTIIEARDNRMAKASLIRELGSEHNEIADSAARELRARGWLQDGSLSSAKLRRANLHRSRLKDADFSGATLRKAVFSEAKTYRATFAGADLRGATFHGAYIGNHEDDKREQKDNKKKKEDFSGADFSGADLFLVDFSNADCYKSNFTKSKIDGCNLRGAILTETWGWLEAESIDRAFYDDSTVWPPELQDEEFRDKMGFIEVIKEDLFITGPDVQSGYLNRKKNPNFK